MGPGAILLRRTTIVCASLALLAVSACQDSASVTTRGDSELIAPLPAYDPPAPTVPDAEVPTPSDSPQPDFPTAGPTIADSAIEESSASPSAPGGTALDPPNADSAIEESPIEESQLDPILSEATNDTSTTQNHSSNNYEMSGDRIGAFLLPSQETESGDWADKGPPRDDTDYLLEDLPTIHEVIDSTHELLTDMHRNIYDYSSPLGALCWSIWEAARAFMQENYGYVYAEGLRLFEEEVAKQKLNDNAANKEPTSLNDKIESGATGRTTETPEYPNDYSILDSLEAVAEGPIRAKALDAAMPAAYLELSQDFFAFIDHQRTLPDPEGFDPDSFTSDYLSHPDGVEILDCSKYVITVVDEGTTTTTTAPDQSIPISSEDEDGGPVTDSDAPPVDDTDDGDDTDSDPTPSPTTTTTTTTTTTVVAPPAPPPPEDNQDEEETDDPDSDEDSHQSEGTADSDEESGQQEKPDDPEDSDSGDDDEDVDDPPPTEETETAPQAP